MCRWRTGRRVVACREGEDVKGGGRAEDRAMRWLTKVGGMRMN